MQHHTSVRPFVGLWIDHRHAIIATLFNAGQEVVEIESHAEPSLHHREDAVYTHYSSNQTPVDDARERHFKGQLQTYYDEIIAHIHQADALLLIGPGEAKLELLKRLTDQHLRDLVVHVENADKMTDKQVAYKVKAYFQSLNVVQSKVLAENATLNLPVKMTPDN
jgi:hypothetical protein